MSKTTNWLLGMLLGLALPLSANEAARIFQYEFKCHQANTQNANDQELTIDCRTDALAAASPLLIKLVGTKKPSIPLIGKLLEGSDFSLGCSYTVNEGQVESSLAARRLVKMLKHSSFSDNAQPPTLKAQWYPQNLKYGLSWAIDLERLVNGELHLQKLHCTLRNANSSSLSSFVSLSQLSFSFPQLDGHFDKSHQRTDFGHWNNFCRGGSRDRSDFAWANNESARCLNWESWLDDAACAELIRLYLGYESLQNFLDERDIHPSTAAPADPAQKLLPAKLYQRPKRVFNFDRWSKALAKDNWDWPNWIFGNRWNIDKTNQELAWFEEQLSKREFFESCGLGEDQSYQDKVILEIGGSHSPLLRKLAAHGYSQVYGLDPAYGAPNPNQDWWQEEGEGRFAVLIPGVGTDLPFKSNSVDLIFMRYVFDFMMSPHHETMVGMIDEIVRVLKPSGLAIIELNMRGSAEGRLKHWQGRDYIKFEDITEEQLTETPLCYYTISSRQPVKITKLKAFGT